MTTPHTPPTKSITFDEQKEITGSDCDAVAKLIVELAKQVRGGDMAAFERFWMSGGTEEGDSKISEIRGRLVMRYLYRQENIRP